MRQILTLVLILVTASLFGSEPIWKEGAKVRGLNPKGVVRLNDFARLAKKLSPTVVNIQVTVEQKLTQRGHPFSNDPMFRFFEHYFDQPRHFRNKGIGSGVVINQDGYILTNNHVVEHAIKIEVSFLDDEALYSAKVVGRDPKTDLALLKVEIANKLPYAPFGDSDQLNIGEWVLAIGNPFGLEHTVTAGIVSAKGRRQVNPGNRAGYYNFIQTDASINPGNSGGPLFNIKGEIVGINTAINASGQGIGFAIPINMAKRVITQILKYGEVKRAWIGVSIQKVSRELAESFGRKNTHGALITGVVTGSPADEAKLQNGDIILKFDGKEIHSSSDLPWIVSMAGIGEGKKMVVLRGGNVINMKITLAPFMKKSAQKNQRQKIQNNQMNNLGIAIRDLSNRERQHLTLKRGVVITGVKPSGIGFELGLQRGDIILKINQHDVQSTGDLINTLSKVTKGSIVRFYIRRGEGHLFVATRL